MLKLLLKLSISVVALTLTLQAVQAEVSPPPRKRNFIENFFGLPVRRANEQPKTTVRSNRDREDGASSLTRERLQRYGSPRDDVQLKPKPVQAIYADPEPDAGLGLGNLDYVPPKTVMIAKTDMASPAGMATLDQAIFQLLTTPDNGLKAVPEEKEAILQFYQDNNFKPLWHEGEAASPRAISTLALLQNADEDGLNPALYLPTGLTSFDLSSNQLGNDPAKLARFDVAMTAATLKFARDLSGGQFDPNRLSKYNDIKVSRVSAVDALDILALTPSPENYFAQQRPQHKAYKVMREKLISLKNTATGQNNGPEIAAGKPVKPGASDQRIPLLRQRLQALGLLQLEPQIFGSEVEEPVGTGDKFDEVTAKALSRFQASQNLKPTGILDNITLKKLNPPDQKEYRERLAINMERLRWLPKELGTRHVFVNQPAFEVRVFDKGVEVWKSAVIVGKPGTQTSAFHDEIETVVFNPTWGVPQSIIVNEYLKKLVNDPGKLDREGFTVINPEGQVVSSSSVNWAGYSKKYPYSVIQESGADNALGELKFLFPNSHHIYMHDTPSRELFEKTERAFSHGCVRVKNPREFAKVLLGWDSARVDSETDSGEHHSVSLPEKIPVHLTYFTAWVNENDEIITFSDIYARDQTIAKAMAKIAERNLPAPSPYIVQNEPIFGTSH